MNQGALRVDDLKSQAEPFLTDKAKAALAIKSMNVTKYVTDERGYSVTTHDCLCIGRKVKLTEVEEGIKVVAGHVNDLAEQGVIDSVLSHFIKLDLSPFTSGLFDGDGNPKELECIVACYVLVDVKTHKRVMSAASHGVINEGSVLE